MNTALSPVHTSDADEPPTVGGTNIHAYSPVHTSDAERQRHMLPPSLSSADQTKKYERSSVVADICQRMS